MKKTYQSLQEVSYLYKFYKVLKGNISKVDSVMHGESFYEAPTSNYIAFIQEGKIYVSHSLTAVPRQLIIDRLIATGTDVAITFKTEFISGPNRTTLHRTTGNLQIAHVTNNKLFYRDGIDGSPQLIADEANCVSMIHGWIDVLYGDEDQGMLVFYTVGSTLYCRTLLDNTWQTPYVVHSGTDTILSIKAQRTPDYRIAIMVKTSNGTKMLLTNRANIKGATQDNALFRVSGEPTISIVSVANPKVIKVVAIDTTTIRITSDVPLKLNDCPPTDMYFVVNDVTLPIVKSITQETSTQFTLTTIVPISFYTDSKLVIDSSTITTPGDTNIPKYVVDINFNNITKQERHNIVSTDIYNIKGDR